MLRNSSSFIWTGLLLLMIGSHGSAEDRTPPDDRPAAKTGYIPALGSIDRPQIQWSYKSGAGIGISDPAAANGMLYFGDDDGVIHAVTAKHGRRVWVHRGATRVYFPPTSDGERLYYSTRRGLTALDCITGHPIWSRPFEGGTGRCLVASELGTVFCAGSDGWLYALDSASGQVKWRSCFIDDVPADPPNFDGNNARFDGTAARPTGISTDGEQVYQSVFDQSRVVAFDVRTGERRWAFQAQGWIFGDSAADEKLLFVGSQDKHLYGLNKKTGQVVWKRATKSRIETGPAVDEQRVYIASCDGHVYCLDKRIGTEVWDFATPAVEGRQRAIYSAPIVTDDTLYFAASSIGRVYALDKSTGDIRWQLQPSEQSQLFSSPATDGERVFVKSRPNGAVGENTLFAIGPADVKTE